MTLKINIKGKEYEVDVSEEAGGKTKVKLNGREFVFDSNSKKTITEGPLKLSDFESKNSEKEIKAPLNGTISEIFVKEKDEIKKGQKLLILSAMKMENEIVSEANGKIKKISVQKGQNVKEGDSLIALL
ncbi:MAG: acetyl-CoA carboxylase biotin carboxyl carrier protein subunit [Candidatus Paceibacterota bacterium]|jgi:biotin carboxyl carrier protein|nr:acetyl-CoA carboxylase biotin carboxyl carrier protein subunit [Candidatus Paceibacterota bacterium]MDD5555293.1 acetyl-CoA carboxylase biotin carboxyl carrier protein subunit [Candidatus Paceibacterota bacterium]